MFHSIVLSALTTLAKVDEAARNLVATHAASAISVAIVKNGQITFTAQAGPVGPEGVFNIGSVTKMFTAVAIMQNVERGRISLDDRVTTFFPKYSAWSSISIRELLTHTSGIPNYLDEALASGFSKIPTTPEKILTATASKPLDFTPGADYNYSNTNYVLLGQILEKVTGQRLGDYESRNIYDVAGMSHTAMARIPSGWATAPPFDKDPLGANAGDMSWYYACGDIYSTASDVARFDIALMNGRLLKPETFLQMQQPLNFATIIPGGKTGLGMYLIPLGTLTLVEHHGGEPGYRADNELVPAKNYAIVVLGAGAYSTDAVVVPALREQFAADVALNEKSPRPVYDPDSKRTIAAANFVRDLLSGTVHTKELTAEMNAGLTPAIVRALTNRLVSAYGTFVRLEFLTKSYTGPYQAFSYAAHYSKGTGTALIVFNAQGSIAGLQMH